MRLGFQPPTKCTFLVQTINPRCKKASLFRVRPYVVVGEEGFDATGRPAPDQMCFFINYKLQMQKSPTLSSRASCSGR
ncbi:hypothetical protein B003_15555 [Vibrio breoganii 1C10]|nr:hypothetical protein B003_15555 [Vibrio breoganii 1C10]